MAKKEFKYRGKTLEEVQGLSPQEFMDLIPSRARRSLKRGIQPQQKRLLTKLSQGRDNVKTHNRTQVILPQMIGKTIKIYSGKEWVAIIITPEMVGHVLGEFSLSRKRVSHSSPGVGATRSSASASVK
jgi:small subunit ribosomal protein S19